MPLSPSNANKPSSPFLHLSLSHSKPQLPPTLHSPQLHLTPPMEVSELLRNPQLSASDNNMVAGESFVIDDLLDFPSDDDPIPLGSSLIHSLPGDSTNSSSLTTAVISSSASNTSLHHPHLSADLCVPVPEDDMAELEWLSYVAEESFSSEDLQKLQLISGIKVEPSETHYQSILVNNNPIFDPDVSVPAKARSKRPRVTPGNWTTRLLHVSPSPSPSISSASSSSDPDAVSHSTAGKKRPAPRRKDMGGEDRRCLHCATNTTPQWRTGPMGPKTLCNACGVRYKSGRLVPEYRPAASPTFVLTKHSNSHRKVMELRRQKEIVQHQQHHQFLHHPNLMFDFHVSNADDYLIHQHLGHDFRHLI